MDPEPNDLEPNGAQETWNEHSVSPARKALSLLLVVALAGIASFWISRCRDEGVPAKSRSNAQRPTKASTSTEVGSDSNSYVGMPLVETEERTSIGEIEFAIRDSEDKTAEPSPYVGIADPVDDIALMDAPTEIVAKHDVLYVLVDYPVTNTWVFKIKSAHTSGFERAELARTISRMYHAIYAEEERTTTIRVIPLEERTGIINRNRTNGKYGIWGHDIGDLVLHSVTLERGANGRVYAVLGIDS